jgi:hypothetical protein
VLPTLRDPGDRAAIEARLATLAPESQRRWGRMTAPQMICHLTDVFRGFLGERVGSKPARPAGLAGRTIVKWVGVWSPIPWPHGFRTSALVDAEKGGTPPAEWARDMAELRAATDRYVQALPMLARERAHFAFGRLSEWEWARWGWRHMNHHLTQFGA